MSFESVDKCEKNIFNKILQNFKEINPENKIKINSSLNISNIKVYEEKSKKIIFNSDKYIFKRNASLPNNNNYIPKFILNNKYQINLKKRNININAIKINKKTLNNKTYNKESINENNLDKLDNKNSTKKVETKMIQIKSNNKIKENYGENIIKNFDLNNKSYNIYQNKFNQYLNNNINNYRKNIHIKLYEQNYIDNKFNQPITQSSIYYRKNNQNLYKYSNNRPYLIIYPYTYISKNIYNNISFNEDIKIAELSMDLIKTQSGAGLLIKKSLANHYFANELLFPKIKNNLKEITSNIIGSSLMKSLLEILSYENIDLFISLIKENILEISLTEPGSIVIQALIERISEFPLLLNKFIININTKNIGVLINSQYGNYIFRKYLSIVKKNEHTEFLYNYIFKNFLNTTNDKYGVCVTIKALSEANENQRKKLLEYILKNLDFIINNSYGNFLIEFILLKFEKKNFNEILPIILKIEENIIKYCTNQYSSSVIEKCFEKGKQEISEHIIKFLLEFHLDSLIDILENPYGFFVIKKSLKINNKNTKEKIIFYIINKYDKDKDKLKKSNNMNKLIFNLSSEYKEFNEIFCKNKNVFKKYI